MSGPRVGPGASPVSRRWQHGRFVPLTERPPHMTQHPRDSRVLPPRSSPRSPGVTELQAPLPGWSPRCWAGPHPQIEAGSKARRPSAPPRRGGQPGSPEGTGEGRGTGNSAESFVGLRRRWGRAQRSSRSGSTAEPVAEGEAAARRRCGDGAERREPRTCCPGEAESGGTAFSTTDSGGGNGLRDRSAGIGTRCGTEARRGERLPGPT